MGFFQLEELVIVNAGSAYVNYILFDSNSNALLMTQRKNDL